MSTKRSRRHVTRNVDQREGPPPKNTLKLTNLPLDTLMHIQYFVEPRDIISLRKCCKTLSLVTRERTVWMNALRRVCSDYSVFALTYPDDMTLIELEYAATSHFRFAAQLWNDLGDRPLAPISIRVLKLHPPRDSTLPSPGGFNNFMLIPGGRFLVTSTDKDMVQIWDLGFMPDVIINQQALASVYVDDLDSGFEFLAQPTPNGQGIILLTTSSPFDEVVFNLFEVYPLSTSPTFRRIASFRHRQVAVDAYALSQDRFTFHGDKSVIVWNFIQDTWVKWTSDQEIFDIIISDDNVVLLQEVEFSVVKIPPLQPRITGIDSNALIPTQTPLLRIVCPLDGVVFSSPYIWHPGVTSPHSNPYYFDVIGGDDEGKTIISRYALRAVPVIGDTAITCMPSVIPVPVDSISDTDVACDAPRFRSAQLCDNSRMVCWVDNVALKVNLSTLPARNGIGRTPKSGVLWRWPSHWLQCSYAICPMAGRLCVSSWDEEIRVLDYVLPPV